MRSMSVIKVHRQHQLGREGARRAAYAWMRHAEKKYQASCRYVAGREHDVVYFSRPKPMAKCAWVRWLLILKWNWVGRWRPLRA